MIQVCYGGGRNSGPMLFGMYERGIRPNVVIFADTGNEKPETYEHLWSHMQPWLASHGMPPITIVRKSGIEETLEEHSLRLGLMPSIVYGFRKCSQKFKIEPTQKFMNNFPAARAAWKSGERILKAVGYHAFEQYRVKPQPADEAEKYDQWFPLIEWNWGPQECEDAFERHGVPLPPKSACFFCPSSRKSEVFALHRNHPDLFERAVAIEQKALVKARVVEGLGRHWSWKELIELDEAQLKLFPETVSMPCVCFDGDPDAD